jgi:phthiocerol/phenolphthiocerol synthesis type-I polyketide synthase E
MSDLSALPMAVDYETTRQLTMIWQELLGLESVGVDQNYFDLGGDSSLAVQLFSRIEKTFHVRLPLATLFEAPTIEELARILQQEAVNSEPAGWSPLVAIQATEKRPVFFCIHGAGGNVLIYRDLARSLGPQQSFYGLQAQGLDGSCEPLRTIEEMAALYVKEIRKFQARGPYFIGGYCMGGTLAYEVTAQLEQAGEEVALLALFDSMDWTHLRLPSLWSKTYHELERVFFHAANFFRLDLPGRRKFLGEKVEALRSRLPVWRGMLRARFSQDPGSTNSDEMVLGKIWQANDLACLHYRPKPIAGSVTDFRPIKQYRMFRRDDVHFGRLARGGERVVELPVYPAGMLVEPFVQHLAAGLKKAIDEAAVRAKS